MPESRSRKKPAYTPPANKSSGGSTRRRGANRWAGPTMVVCFVVGLAWVAVYYIGGQSVPGMNSLGNYNLLIGMGLIAIGCVVATRWE